MALSSDECAQLLDHIRMKLSDRPDPLLEPAFNDVMAMDDFSPAERLDIFLQIFAASIKYGDRGQLEHSLGALRGQLENPNDLKDVSLQLTEEGGIDVLKLLRPPSECLRLAFSEIVAVNAEVALTLATVIGHEEPRQDRPRGFEDGPF